MAITSGGRKMPHIYKMHIYSRHTWTYRQRRDLIVFILNILTMIWVKTFFVDKTFKLFIIIIFYHSPKLQITFPSDKNYLPEVSTLQKWPRFISQRHRDRMPNSSKKNFVSWGQNMYNTHKPLEINKGSFRIGKK